MIVNWTEIISVVYVLRYINSYLLKLDNETDFIGE